MTQLERLLPRYHFVERHATEVAAPPERVLAAVREVTPPEAPLLRALFRLRGLPGRRDEPILAQLLAGFELLVDEPQELVFGAIGRPWNLTERLRRDRGFIDFDEPGYAKMALGFWVDGRLLRTETRIFLTDARARRSFARYWLIVRPLSGLTRRSWLRAAKRRAERR
jgi:hypothetical protein